jgi:hypothetical protein
MAERMGSYDTMLRDAAKAWMNRDSAMFAPDGMSAGFIPSATERPEAARRGSGTGYHSPEAKAQRTRQHEMNAVSKVTPEDQARAWHYRHGEPVMVFNGRVAQS